MAKFIGLVLFFITSIGRAQVLPPEILVVKYQDDVLKLGVNETGGVKLGQILRAFAGANGNEFKWTSPDHDLEMGCKRGVSQMPQQDPFMCAFKFYHSNNVAFDHTHMQANISGTDGAEAFNLQFKGLRGESFAIHMKGKAIQAQATY